MRRDALFALKLAEIRRRFLHRRLLFGTHREIVRARKAV